MTSLARHLKLFVMAIKENICANTEIEKKIFKYWPR
jgi:hypothetical protein